MDKQTVVKSNAVIEASYRLDPCEFHVLHACLAQIDSTVELKELAEFTLHAADYAKLTGVSRNRAYDALKEASAKLLQRRVSIKDSSSPESKNDYLVTLWVYAIKYRESTASITLCFSPYILPYLTQLKGKYTQYELQNVSKMKSIYAIRLYEWLMQWKTTRTLEISLDEYRQRLQVVSKYASIKDLKLYTLKPALKGINEISDIIVEFDQKKSGRIVTHFVFTWEYKKPKKIKKKTSPKKLITPEEYANIHPRKTQGKTRAEVISMIKEDYVTPK